jgi:putative transposase
MGELLAMIKYKSEWYRKPCIVVGKTFPSSQMCNKCGYINSLVKNTKIREWVCPNCEAHHDRDVNAAINLRNEGIKINNAKI